MLKRQYGLEKRSYSKKNTRHLILSLLFLFSFLFTSHLFAEEDSLSEGGTVLFSFIYRQNNVELRNITFYKTEPRIKRIKIPQPWKAILLDAFGNELFSLDFPNPTLISPRDETLPVRFTVRVPYLKAAVRFQLKDESERLIYQIDLSSEILQKAKERQKEIEQDLQHQKERIENYYNKFGKLPAKVEERRPEDFFLNDYEKSGNIEQWSSSPKVGRFLPPSKAPPDFPTPFNHGLPADKPHLKFEHNETSELVLTNSSLDCSGVIDLTLDVPYSGTTVGGSSIVNSYSCVGRNESGPEKVHRITTTTAGNIVATLSNAASNLEVFILSSCSSGSCLVFGSVSAAYPNAPPGTYYVAVDGYNGASGKYTLTVSMGKVLRGKVTDGNGLGVASVRFYIYGEDGSLAASVNTDSSGVYSAYVPPETYHIDVYPPSGTRYCQRNINNVTVSGDTELNIQLESGFLLTGTVMDLTGAPIGHVWLFLYLNGGYVGETVTDYAGHYSVALKPGTYDLQVYLPPGYFGKWINDIAISRDTALDIQLEGKTNLNVRVYDSLQNRITGAGVQIKDPETDQAWDGANTDSNGVTLVAIPNRPFNMNVEPPSASSLLRQILENVNPSASSLDVTLQRGNVLSGTAYYPSGQKASYADVDVFALDENHEPVNAVQSDGQGNYSLVLPSGTFTVWARDRSGDYREALVTINSDMTLDLHMTSGAVQTVSGSIRDSKGNLVSGSSVVVYNETGNHLGFQVSGRFSGNVLSDSRYGIIIPPANTRFLMKTFDITPGMSWDFVLDELPEAPEDNPLSLIYGDSADKTRVNFVIIGDGYTDLNEPFTDSNGNGIWDGDLYLDENGNGKYDPGEHYYDRNRNGVYDPSEPFVDTNGDGVRNFNEQAILDQNALDLARSLLGAPIIKDYADRINIWKVRLISNQTCGDFPEFGIKRDTALNTTYGGKDRSFLIGIDAGKAAEIIQALLPEYDYIITLSYCPLGIGRGGASSGSEGRVAWNGADYSLVGSGLAHEYGHAIGLLGDEYSEFPGMHLEGEPSVPNVTTVLDEAKIKWKDYLTLATPSPPYAPGVGAFEGAHYYPKGVYRPVYDCMMRSLSPWYCPICSDQMVKRLNELTGTVSYTVTTNPPELQVQVDSTIYTAPHRFSWVPDTTHTLSVSSPQNGTLGTRYVYSSWSDGGAQTHTVTVPSSSTTYTATFSTTQYQLTIASSPPAGGTVTPSPMGDQSGIACPASVGVICPGYYPSGTSVTLTATPNTGYSFSGWSGDLSGTANPTSVTMNGPKTVTANFTATSVTPTAYDFGNVKVKKSKTASFVVKNNGKDNLSITSAITGSDASMFKITSGSGSKKIKPGKTVTIKVAFKPTSKGLKSSELKITSNDPNTPTIDVPLTGTGQ